MIEYCYDDGGRRAAGYKGDTGDCVTRAIAIATGMPYRDAYQLVNEHGGDERIAKRQRRRSSARTGVQKRTSRQIFADLGWAWTPTMHIGSGCQVHLTAEELPPGRIVVAVSGHIAAVIDGVLHDNHDCSRDGKRCVYGYWRKELTR
jgi:hypothetical protein